VLMLKASPNEFKRFLAQTYFAEAPRKPRCNAKPVVDFILRPESKNERSRATKCAKILDRFLRDNVAPDAVVERLKKLGGIENAYAGTTGRPVAKKLKGEEPTETSGGASAKPGPKSHVVPMANAQAGATAVGNSDSPRPMPLMSVRVNLRTTLLVTMEPHEIEKILALETATVELRVAQASGGGLAEIAGHLIDTEDDS
jgi:hypothetical protein